MPGCLGTQISHKPGSPRVGAIATQPEDHGGLPKGSESVAETPLCRSAGAWTPDSTCEETVSYPRESQGLAGFVRQGPQEVGQEEKAA